MELLKKENFAAPRDIYSRLATAFTLITFVFLSFYWLWKIFWGTQKLDLWLTGILLFLLLVLLWAYGHKPTAYTLDHKGLLVRRRWGRPLFFPFSSILDIRELAHNKASALIPFFRIGGVFGYLGIYQLPGLGRVTMLATRRDELVLVRLHTDKSYLLSPHPREDFMAALPRDKRTLQPGFEE
ncbi:MAG: PH domain-containing protein [Schleiferiaceae bacterium]|nr:PH domain-containing protein [Schleiferiaceae bacterium]